jgi:hypothetical protein
MTTPSYGSGTLAKYPTLRFRKTSAILERILLQGRALGVLSQQV